MLANSLRTFVALICGIGLGYFVINAPIIAVATSAVPNVTLLSVLVALSMKLLCRPRVVFYATLSWPVLHFFLDADRVMREMAGLRYLGQDPNLEIILRAQNLPVKASGMLLTYSLFSILVYFMYGWLTRRSQILPLQVSKASP